VVAAAPIEAQQGVSFPAPLKVLLELALVVALALFTLAFIPVRALPDRVVEVVGGRRERFAFGGLCILCLGLFVGFVALLFGS
jgi:hypothetical protein